MSTEVIHDLETTPVEQTPPVFRELLTEFVNLEHERRELESKLKILEDRVKVLGPQLIDQFADTGIQNTRCQGLTVYVRMDRYVSKKAEYSSEQVCKALERVGLGYMVADSYNAASLKSKVKEYEDAGVAVPPELAELLNIGSVPRLSTRK